VISTSKIPLKEVVIGQEVFWTAYQSNGIVLSEPDAAGKVWIQSGDVKVKVPLNELTSSSNTAVKLNSINVRMNFEQLKNNEIDVRGYRVDDAIVAVDKFLDDAILSELDQVYIIHGKGTGALKEAIHKFLNTNLRVKAKGFPRWNPGDTGMTVVDLK